MIGQGRFERALAYVRRSEVHRDLEVLLRPDGNVGAPRQLAVDVLLAGMMLTFEEYGSLALTKVHEVLTTSLPRNVQTQYGLRSPNGRSLTLRQVRYTWNTINDRLDHTKTRSPGLDEVARAERAEQLTSVVDRLVGAAGQVVAPEGRWAVDETAVDAAARFGFRTNAAGARKVVSADPDARLGYRTKTQANRSKHVFGYQMTAFARIGAVGEAEVPLLIDRFAVTPGNVRGTRVAVEALESFQAEGVATREVVIDRGISFAKSKNWAEPLRDMGVEQVLDMHPIDQGPRPMASGVLMLDGWAHCPSTPEKLLKISRPTQLSIGPKPKRGKVKIAKWKKRKRALKQFSKQIAERQQYRFERMGKTSNGNERFRCPARAGKIACSGCPLSMDSPPEVPEVTPPTELPKACAQETITIGPEASSRLRQKLYWGSEEWIRSYARRTRVEGSFGVLKGARGGRLQRGWTHQVGIVKTTFLLAIAVSVQNLNILTAWAHRTGDTRDPLTQMDVTVHGFVELAADGSPVEANAPPGS